MRPRDGWPGLAALAVAVLYGLLLSTFLGAMAPIGHPSPGVVCARDGGHPAGPFTPAGAGDCCTLGCFAAPVGPPPSPAAFSRAPPSQAVAHETEPAWTTSRLRPPTDNLPRGPPAV